LTLAAPEGQAATQFPHPLHITSFTTDIFFASSKVMEPYEQTERQSLHPMQRDSDI
jgi:hypothetical protein